MCLRPINFLVRKRTLRLWRFRDAGRVDAKRKGMSCPHLFFTYPIGYIIAHMKIAYSTDRQLYWVGSSKKDLLVFPDDVVSDIGYALGVVQQG